jgi:hypothetical protein
MKWYVNPRLCMNSDMGTEWSLGRSRQGLQ